MTALPALPAPGETAANEPGEVIPSISFEALLARRDAAVAHLQAIRAAAEAYLAIGTTLRLTPGAEYHVPYRYGRALDCRHGPDVGSETWLKNSTATLDALLWDELLSASGLRTFMDAQARRDWHEQIEKNATPPLTRENVQATFRSLHAQRGELFERGVIQVFRNLSWDYKTNQPCRFGKRIVIRGVSCRLGGYSDGRCDHLDDLERVFHVLDGKPEPDHREGIYRRLHRADGAEIADAYLRIRTFKNGNGHVTFLRPDLVDQLNRILARHYPDALPPAEKED